MESILPRDDVTFEEDTLDGVAGLWVHPAGWRSDEAILHLHGGWFSFGSANAFRHLVAHIAARAAARAFIPDYRLAPEHSFPAAPDDALACCQGLAKRDVHQIALTGDSAGGNLALGLASRITGRLAVRELVDAYTRCADRRDVEGQMPLFTADTEFLVYMDSRNPTLT
jgi:acetyl esterase/lipase